MSPIEFVKNQTSASAYIHIAVITPTAIVIISTLMVMVLKRIRLWISAITFTLRADMTIRRIKVCDEFLLFLRERDISIEHVVHESQGGHRISRFTSKAVSHEQMRENVRALSSDQQKKRLLKGGGSINGSHSTQIKCQSKWSCRT